MNVRGIAHDYHKVRHRSSEMSIGLWSLASIDRLNEGGTKGNDLIRLEPLIVQG
jgi:hypothetical protein